LQDLNTRLGNGRGKIKGELKPSLDNEGGESVK